MRRNKKKCNNKKAGDVGGDKREAAIEEGRGCKNTERKGDERNTGETKGGWELSSSKSQLNNECELSCCLCFFLFGDRVTF